MADGPDQYDVAISFLARDQEIAQQLCDSLAGIDVFFFPRNQDELAGTNGMETMRDPFINARVIVILYREPWGNTPWTRVESTAIQERCLSKGWDGLVFVSLDNSQRHPQWVPNNFVRYNVQDFGLPGLTGVVKARVLDTGGQIRPLDAATVAQRARLEGEYLADRVALMRNSTWISTLRQSITYMLEDACALAIELGQANQMQIVAGARNLFCVMRSQQWITLNCQWRQPFVNSVRDEDNAPTFLSVREMSGGLPLPGEQIGFAFQPTTIREHRFKIDVDRNRAPVWKEVGSTGHIAPEKMADRIVQIFFTFIQKANRGEVEPPFM